MGDDGFTGRVIAPQGYVYPEFEVTIIYEGVTVKLHPDSPKEPKNDV